MISDRPSGPRPRHPADSNGAPFLGIEVIGDQLDLSLGIIAPFALHSHPQPIVLPDNPLESIAAFVGQKFGRQGNFLLDLALGINLVDRMKDQPVAAPFRGQPEPALSIRVMSSRSGFCAGSPLRVTTVLAVIRAGVWGASIV